MTFHPILCILTFLLCTTTAKKPEDVVGQFKNKLQHLIDTQEVIREDATYEEKEINDLEEYDFVIVGAGSAGSVIANRLSEIPEWKILLLEAGDEPEAITDIPMWALLSQFTDQNWNYKTEKEGNIALGFEGQRLKYPRGKGLGGSSLINYLLYSRGNPLDYDQWAERGNPGWSFNDVLPIFKKIEDYKLPNQEEKNLRFRGGDISIEEPKYRTKSAEVFVEGAQKAGYKYVDYNGMEQIGVSHAQTITKNGLRWSTEKAYIRPAKNRNNLTIRKNCFVTKLLIDAKKVCGVEFKKGNAIFTAKAAKEVILSAGAINTPQILLLSGIGPKQHLEAHDIKLVVDLPVGKQLYDHPAFYGLAISLNESITLDLAQIQKEENIKDLYNKGEGPLTAIGGAESVVFTSTPINEDERPDIEIIHVPQHVSTDGGILLRNTVKISDETYEALFKPLENRNIFLPLVVLMHPKSFGRLELRSKDPFEYPKIYSGFFTDRQNFDLKTMIEGVKETIRIMTTEPFSKYGAEIVELTPKGCQDKIYGSDDYWECCLRHLTSMVFHHTATCKMGAADDPYSVVNNRLKVYGVRNLRVADASVIPVSITGHTHIPCVVVGEKAAKIIKEEYLIK